MKKFHLSILFFLLPLVTFAQQNNFTIKGTGETLSDGDTIYLCDINQLSFAVQRLDSAIVRNGVYRFTGSAPGCKMRYILPFKNGNYVSVLAILLENADYTIHSYDAYNRKEPDVQGGENHQLYKAYKYIQKKWSEEMVPFGSITRDPTKALEEKLQAQQKVDSLMVLQREEEFQFMMDHLPALFTDMILSYNYSSFTSDQKEKALAAFKEKYPEGANYKRILSQQTVTDATEIGKMYTDFTMPDPDGKSVSISEVIKKNKLTLVDFWASWCVPCRQEMPNVVEAYNRYHAKGFEIVGVSLDSNREAWLKGIKSFQMPWPQMSDLKGWKSEGAQLYNVKGIPANVLINNKGEIVARDLRGLTLINRVGELLK